MDPEYEADDGPFYDRADAGARLAARLRRYAGRDDVLVLALPRGGAPVGVEVARSLAVPLDVFRVPQLGVPGREELAMGAIASGMRVLNEDVVRELSTPRSHRKGRGPRIQNQRWEMAYRQDGRGWMFERSPSWWTTGWPPGRR